MLNYKKENCRWATSKQQARNRTTTKVLLFKGEETTLADIAEKYGVPKTTIYRRYSQGLRGDALIDRTNRLVHRTGSKSPNAKLTQEKADEIRLLIANKVTHAEISKLYSISTAVISEIRNNKTWVKHDK